MPRYSLLVQENAYQLHDNNLSIDQIAEKLNIPYKTVKKWIVDHKLSKHDTDKYPDRKIKAIQTIQTDILDEMILRDYSTEDLQKLSNTFKTMHTAEREETGKADGLQDLFLDLLQARNRSSRVTIDAEFEEVESEGGPPGG